MFSPFHHLRLPMTAFGAVCVGLLFLAGSQRAEASCGDYLRSHIPHEAMELASLPSRQQVPLLPCRCQGVECQSTPGMPAPTEPSVTRHFDQSAWWIDSLERHVPSPRPRILLQNEVCDGVTSSAIEHVPIAAHIDFVVRAR